MDRNYIFMRQGPRNHGFCGKVSQDLRLCQGRLKVINEDKVKTVSRKVESVSIITTEHSLLGDQAVIDSDHFIRYICRFHPDTPVSG